MAISRLKTLLSGNEAIAEGALRAGCRCYFGYPITPQSEIAAYMAKKMKEVGGVFIQAESELASINMVFGAAAAGARCMTTSSSPGTSLMQESLSYLAGAELPAVIVNIMRGGPGLGNIAPSQSDYFQATKGGGHGDYHLIVLAPASVQEMADFTFFAFDLADKYRNPVMILADAILGQLMEGVKFKKRKPRQYPKPWAVTGCEGREPNIIHSLFLKEGELEKHNLRLQKKYEKMREKEVRFEIRGEEPGIVLVAYGSMARVCEEVRERLKEEGEKISLFRPLTLWPFPYQALRKWTREGKFVLVVEMSEGQLLEDVRLALEGKKEIFFYGRMGGGIPTPEETYRRLKELTKRKEERLANRGKSNKIWRQYKY